MGSTDSQQALGLPGDCSNTDGCLLMMVIGCCQQQLLFVAAPDKYSTVAGTVQYCAVQYTLIASH